MKLPAINNVDFFFFVKGYTKQTETTKTNEIYTFSGTIYFRLAF